MKSVLTSHEYTTQSNRETRTMSAASGLETRARANSVSAVVTRGSRRGSFLSAIAVLNANQTAPCDAAGPRLRDRGERQ